MTLARWSIILLLIVHLFGLDTAAAPLPVDQYGDELPRGAVMRLGTIRLRHTGHLNAVAFSPDGKTLASAGVDGAVRLWEEKSGEPIRSLTGTVDQWTHGIAFSPDGAKLASVGGGGLVRLWDVASGKELFKSQSHEGRVQCVAYAPDGFTFATAGADGTVRLWDAATAEELLKLESSDGDRDWHAVAFSPDGNILAAGASTTIHLWSLDTGERRAIENVHGNEIVSLAFLPDGNSLVSSGMSRYFTQNTASGKPKLDASSEIRVWNVASGKLEREFKAEDLGRGVCAIALSNDGKTLVSVHREQIKIWNVETGALVRTIADYINMFGVQAHGVAISPDGGLFAVRSPGNALWLYSVETGQRVLPFPEAHEDQVLCAATSPSGKRLATGGGDQSLRLWDLDTGKQTRRIRFGKGSPASVGAVAFASDDKVLAMGGHRPDLEFIGLVSLFDMKSGEPIFEQELTSRGCSAAMSTDGKMFAVAEGRVGIYETGTSKPVISLWTTESKKQVATLSGHEGTVCWMAFSPDNKTLVSADEGMAIRRWDVEQGKLLSTVKISGHQRPSLRSVAFTPDCKTAVTSALFDSLVIVSDVATGQEVRRIEVEKTKGSILAISPDGRLLATAAIGLTNTTEKFDRSIRLWELSSGRELLRFDLTSNNAASLTFSPDGARLISGMNDGTTLVWDIRRASER